jgi:flavin reductase (DIM6/NTAB) family NADH-FMN oxidoreductase RutF
VLEQFPIFLRWADKGGNMKKKIGNQNVLYPTPVTIVGALVNGKINFINIAHVGILNVGMPHLISLGMGKIHHTNAGIRENKTFSSSSTVAKK